MGCFALTKMPRRKLRAIDVEADVCNEAGVDLDDALDPFVASNSCERGGGVR